VSQGAESAVENRYSKSKLLDIFRAQQISEMANGDVTKLFMNNWDPGHSNGINGRGWSRSNDTRDHNHGPDACWDQTGQNQPIGLEEMSATEKSVSEIKRLSYSSTKVKQIFASDVNSPLKPPPQNISKDQNTPGSASNGRKSSVSHGQGGSTNFSLTSPTSTRPGTRRRETSDSLPYGGLVSPSATSRFNRDEMSQYFGRKANESDDRPDEVLPTSGMSKMSSPFGGLVRGNTVANSFSSASSSPWGSTPQNSGLSPMGNFGSFALPGASGPTNTATEKRPGLANMRGESRLAHLMPKASSEDLASKAGDAIRSQDTSRPWRSRPRTDTDPFEDLTPASLASGQEERQDPGFDTPARQVSNDFGMSDMPGFRDSIQRREQAQQTPQQATSQEHFSPTDTNPYGSPAAGESEDVDVDEAQQIRGHALSGIPEHGFTQMPRGFTTGAFDGSDRSQTSSAGAQKGFPSLGGLGLGGIGWPTTGHQIGTPDRERPGFQGAFGNSIFGSMGDLQSPGLSNLGHFGASASSNLAGSASNTVGRGSKLGSLFPAAMQAQMQGTENDNPLEEQRQGSGFGAISRNAFGGPSRDTDSPMRSGRGVFDDLLPASETRSQGNFSSAESTQPTTSAAPAVPSYSQPQPAQSYQQPQSTSESTASQLPQTQQRTMVMPDRMRWVYLDPQGQVQGPWSGLEMHDWYKASFFTADLSVKKVEDAEFEPLGQLIRRIGNSREPFLVPQIGVPHGPPTTQAPFASTTATSGAPGAQPGSVQPPFAGAFPSFGTTLTAEQQNNLERRKQEEQYLMARQREFLAQQQVTMKQMQMQGALPAVLHHHSSAHSLQSQPSFGSITSPIGMATQGPILGAQGVPGFFDNSRQPGIPAPMPMPPDYLREDELARLSLDRPQGFGIAGPQPPQPHQHPPIFPQQHDTQREPARIDQMNEADAQAFKARRRDFEQLRAQHDMEQSVLSTHMSGEHPAQQRQALQSFLEKAESKFEEKVVAKEPEVLSLTQQVQKAASAKDIAQPESPWGKVSTGLPMPFPAPPQSTTPLPAPTAQRGRSNLPEALTIESRSRSETPDMPGTTPSIAPWAKEQSEAPKGPSLKEIQEAEAKKAAKAEEAAAAARRALLEQELRSQPAAPAPGLPTTSTWGNSSPATPSTPSAWAKPVTKSQTSNTINSSKKTLADIQREEELRKQKLAATSAATAIPGHSISGKRYADLASKPTSVIPTTGAAWSTVGAGGKVKIPTGPAAATPMSAPRAMSGTSLPAIAKTARPATVTRSITTGNTTTGPSGVSVAQQEFTKWAKNALAKGLNPDINGKRQMAGKLEVI
jgi:PERQ amino acid-rich with GYF domain-containing protein